MQYVSYLWKTRTKREFLSCIILCILSAVLPAVMIPTRSTLIDSAIAGSRSFALWCGIFLFLSIGEAVLTSTRQWFTSRHQQLRARELDQNRLHHAGRVPYAVTETESFHSLYHQASEAPKLEQSCYGAWQDLLLTSVQIAAVMMTLAWIDGWTAAGVVILLIGGIVIHLRAAKGSPGFWGRYMENMRRTNYFASLLLHREYAAERKLFGWEYEINDRFTREFEKARKENLQLGKKRLTADSLLEVFSAIFAVCTVLLLLRPLHQGAITIGMFTSAFYAANTLRGRIGQMCSAAYTLQSDFSQMKAYDQFMELPGNSIPASVPAGTDEAVIRFRDVSFAYPGQEKPILQHLNLTMEAGKHYALVGENGSGKSTLVKLMVGLYQPDCGEILINGRQLSSLSDEEKQKLFTVVFQDFYRYPLTIRENLSLGQPELLTDAQIERILDALDFSPAALEKGLDADLLLLQKEGSGLSGGEWQKLTIARSILSPAPIAVLDEPNAALDPVAEAQIYRAYQTLLQSKTTLFISHRLGSVREADSIFVLRDGQLLAAGNHELLMESCSYYRELFETQRGLYDEIK